MPQKTEIEVGPENSPETAENRASEHSSAPPPRDPAPATSRRRISSWTILVIVVLVAVIGTFVWNYLGKWESTDDAEVDGHINLISARVGGYVMKVNVDDNQAVGAGTVLVEIDPKDYQVAVDRARADYDAAIASANAAQNNVPITSANSASQLDSAHANVESARAGVLAAEGQAAAAVAQLAQIEANDSKAQSDVVRYKQLVDKKEISEQQYEQALDAAKATAAGVNAAKASANAAQEQVHQAQSHLLEAQASLRAAGTAPQQILVSKAQFSSADASVAQKKAALDQALLNLQYCTIVAPVAGVVSKNVEVGMNITSGQQLISVVPLDDVWVTADFKETQLKLMRPGQPAEISVDAYGRKYKGHVDSIAGASGARFSLLPPENATGNYVKVVQRVPVKIVLEQGENKDHLLRPGMSVVPKVKVK